MADCPNITPSDIRARFPEFAQTDQARIQVFIDDAYIQMGNTLSEQCSKRSLLTAYLTAHLLKRALQTASGGGTAPGPLASRSVGDVSVSFGLPETKNQTDAYYLSTSYGQEYLRLLKRFVGAPIMVC